MSGRVVPRSYINLWREFVVDSIDSGGLQLNLRLHLHPHLRLRLDLDLDLDLNLNLDPHLHWGVHQFCIWIQMIDRNGYVMRV